MSEITTHRTTGGVPVTSAQRQPLVTIITVNFHQAVVTCEMLVSLRAVDYPALEVIVVDNEVSQAATAQFTAAYPAAKVLGSEVNLGFAGGNNLALQQAKGAYILLLNNDTLVPPDFLSTMVQIMEENPTIGILSPKIFFCDPPQLLQYAGSSTINPYTGRGESAKYQADAGQFDHTIPTGMAHGACMLVRSAVFATVGWLDETFFLYYEELDFCERARRAGWPIYFTGSAHIWHRESMSLGKNSPTKTYYLYRNRWLFMRKHYGGWRYYCFVLYYLSIAVPRHLLRYLWQGDWSNGGAILRAVNWNIRRSKTITQQ